MAITSLEFNNLGPFDSINFDFDEQANIFVGPNNSGKSTVLLTLGEILVYPFSFPHKLLRKKLSKYNFEFKESKNKKSQTNGKIPILFPRNKAGKNYQNEYLSLLRKIGFSIFIPALRYSTSFRSQGPISSEKEKRIIRARKFSMEYPHDYMDLPDNEDYSEIFDNKEPLNKYLSEDNVEEHKKRCALIETDHSLIDNKDVSQSIIELDYKAYREKKPEIRLILDKITLMASQITEGFPISFSGVQEDKRGLFLLFETPDGKMPVDNLSQGTQSIIQWLSHLVIGYAKYYDFPKNLEDKPGVLIIDEIDAHLHPSWQRRLIPTLTKNFPKLQIFCSTHSPLMLAGLKSGQVQLLQRNSEGGISVSRNDKDIIGWSSDEIQRNFMGVEETTDLHTSEKINRIQKLTQKKRLMSDEKKELNKLRLEINEDLVKGPIASQFKQFSEMFNDIKIKTPLILKSSRKKSLKNRKTTKKNLTKTKTGKTSKK